MRPRTPARRCPRCRQTFLEPCSYEGQSLDICPRCRGLWCEPSHWDRQQLGPFPHFTREGQDPPAEPAAEPQAPAEPFAPAVPAPDVRCVGTSTLSCPTCRCPMADLVVGDPDKEGPAPFEIDQCERCGGIWFDADEWDALQAYRAWQKEEKKLDTPTTWGEWSFQFFLGVPLEFNVPPRRFPSVTVGLIVLCTLVFFVQVAVGPEQWVKLALEPNHLLTLTGWASLLTCTFLHANLLHLVGNMYFLFLLGQHVEDVLGRWRFLAFYLACGLSASLVHVLAFPHSGVPVVGASGAIAGVMAAYAVLFPRARLTFMLIFWQFKASPWVYIGVFLAFQVIGAAMDLGGKGAGVAHIAHLGGFVAGLLLVLPWRQSLIAGHPLLRLLHTWRKPPALEAKAVA